MREYKVTRVTATTQVVSTIRNAIQQGELKIGDKLPNEAELAGIIGVGRSAIREGMCILAAYGIVEVRQGDGTFITNKFTEQVFESMGFLPNAENIRHLIHLRRVIEMGCLKMVYNKLTPLELQELESLANEIDTTKSVEHNIEADRKYHEKLVFHTNNPLIIQIYHMMASMLSSQMQQLMCYQEVTRDAMVSHHMILSALKKCDLEESILAMDDHLKKIEKYIDKYIPANNNP